MALLTTSEAFLDCVRRSGLVPAEALEATVEMLQARDKLAGGPAKVARQLIRDGLLTRYQTEQLLQGKWKRFDINGKYRLLERLGSGGMANVFLCEHLFLRRRVAIKLLPVERSRDGVAIERFYREARAVASLDHPNIVRAHDIDHDGEIHYIVMEYVEGRSLHAIVSQRGPLSIERTAHYIAQAAEALQHAHEAGLIHRDIKPGNLLLDKSGTIKVLDMGLARFFHDSTDNLTQRHESKVVLGTADYLSPEQAIDSHAVDIRSDIYSLGITFYFLLTGKAPCGEGTIAEKLLWHQMRSARPIQELRPEIPPELAAVLAKMMARSPDERYQQPLEVVEALRAWTGIPIPPPSSDELPQLSPAVARMCESTVTLRPPTAPGIRLPKLAAEVEKEAVPRSIPTPSKAFDDEGKSAAAPPLPHSRDGHSANLLRTARRWSIPAWISDRSWRLLAIALGSFMLGAIAIGLTWFLTRN
jgi:serine/threonine protein kinase